jgi:hypothetical protein
MPYKPKIKAPAKTAVWDSEPARHKGPVLTRSEVHALTSPQKPKAGRPSLFSAETANRLNELVAAGLSVRRICLMPGMPDRSTVNRWLADPARASFATSHARAREAQADTIHDEMVEIEVLTLRGKVTPDVARVVLSSQQWRAARLAPKKYGAALGIGQAEALAAVTVEIKNYGGLTPGKLAFGGDRATEEQQP